MESMLFLLAKRKSCSVIRLLPLLNPRLNLHHRCCFSSSASETQHSTSNFIVDYLISSFGFSPDKASKVSKTISHLKSPEQPDSVRHFLNQQGFTEAHIKSLITSRPNLLCSSPENTLDPNLRALRGMGLSTSALTQIIVSDPAAIMTKTCLPRIKFWRDFLGGSEETLLRALKKNVLLARYDTAPKISFLESHGLSAQDIRNIVLRISRFMLYNENSMEDWLKRAKELGFQPGSGMFVWGLGAVCSISREMLERKKELLKKFGWSEADFFTALRKSPTILSQSEKSLQSKLDFLTGEFKCDPSYIASHPVIVTYSLEKRLRPRHHVLHLVESELLSNKGKGLCGVISLTNEKFVERFVLPHKDMIPGLYEAYLAACA